MESGRSLFVWPTGLAWSSVDRPSAKRWADSLNKADGDIAWTGIISFLVEPYQGKTDDPDTAAREFSSRFPSLTVEQVPQANNGVKNLAGEIATAWNKQGHPERALQWILTFPDNTDRDDVAASLFQSWAADDPLAVAAAAGKLPPGSIHELALMVSSSHLAKKDAFRALEIAKTIKDKGTREKAFFALSEPLAKKQPDQAFEITKEIQQPLWREKARVAVFGIWLQLSPQEALNSLNALQKEERERILLLIKDKVENPPIATF
jgi:hypothetical protein